MGTDKPRSEEFEKVLPLPVVYFFSVYLKVAFGVVSASCYLHRPVKEPYLLYGHLVLCQGTCLVGTDDIGTSERFRGLQTAEQGFLPYHCLDPQCQCDGHDGRQTLGYDRYGKRDARKEHLHHIFAQKISDDRDERSDGDREDPEFFPQDGQFLLQRCLCIAHFAGHLCDLPEFGMHACGNDHPFGIAVDDVRPHPCHGSLFAQCAFLRYGLCTLQRGDRLSGKCGFVCFEVDRFNKPEICRYLVADLKEDNIAGDQFGRIDLHLLSFPQDPASEGKHLLKGLYGFFRLEFLNEPENTVQHDNDHNGDGISYLPYRKRDGCSDQKDDDQDIRELSEEDPLPFLFTDRPYAVGSVVCQALCRFRPGKTFFGVCTKEFQYRGDLLCIPCCLFLCRFFCFAFFCFCSGRYHEFLFPEGDHEGEEEGNDDRGDGRGSDKCREELYVYKVGIEQKFRHDDLRGKPCIQPDTDGPCLFAVEMSGGDHEEDTDDLAHEGSQKKEDRKFGGPEHTAQVNTHSYPEEKDYAEKAVAYGTYGLGGLYSDVSRIIEDRTHQHPCNDRTYDQAEVRMFGKSPKDKKNDDR